MKKIEQKGRVTFGEAVSDFFKGYFDFSGRTTRAGYWWAQLSIVIVYIILYIWTISTVIGSIYGEPNMLPIILLVLFTLAIIIPSISIQVRRLRDLGIKGKALLGLFIIYYGLTYTWLFSFYLNAIGNIASTVSNSLSTGELSIFSNQSSLIMFLFTVISIFMSISMFLPTNYFVTNSEHPFITFLFVSKKDITELTEIVENSETNTINDNFHENEKI
ncbi:hypothetical protein BW731_09895 [Vagococcus martis]|uniref:DUF805 domain-containing protein n=1 Tax=Vagococcus martis TaxID=1768210 RepID=A0A1V4DJH8_9ENTE|nr:DUF805 domain-containing protein [Vagococcus martis]OPF88466.1 hypothetical protein BW731_09895 [Vagococcus martis]